MKQYIGTTVVVSNVAMMAAMFGLYKNIDRVADDVSDIGQEVASVREDVAVIQKSLLIETKKRVSLTPDEKLCLARNIFFEAGVEPHEGKIAVAQVTYNRLKTGRWGSYICDVVYSKAQFCWTLDRSKKWATPKGELWDRSLKAVSDFRNGVRVNDLSNSLYYHADYVDPYWKDPSKKVSKIGRHIFYTAAKRA